MNFPPVTMMPSNGDNNAELIVVARTAPKSMPAPSIVMLYASHTQKRVRFEKTGIFMTAVVAGPRRGENSLGACF